MLAYLNARGLGEGDGPVPNFYGFYKGQTVSGEALLILIEDVGVALTTETEVRWRELSSDTKCVWFLPSES